MCARSGNDTPTTSSYLRRAVQLRRYNMVVIELSATNGHRSCWRTTKNTEEQSLLLIPL